MQFDDSRRLVSILLARVAEGASSTDIAGAIVTTLEEVDLALSPIIGKRGVAALLKRSLHLAGARHAWLRGHLEDGRMPIDFEPLRSVLACQSGSESAAAGGELLRGFRELLSALIGLPLTEQLLGSAWSHIAGGPPAEEASS